MQKQWMAAILMTALFIGANGPVVPSASAEVRNSRLSQLIKRKPNLYLPSRLLIGQENKFTLQGTPGHEVTLYISPQDAGLKAPNGQLLRVGEESEAIKGIIPQNGVLSLAIPLPDDTELDGKEIFVEAITWKAPDYSDLEILELVDSTGRRSSENKLAIAKPTKGKGAFILPSMPGVSPQMIQQITTLSEIQKGDTRKRDLIYSGDVNKDILQDQNVFINRPGGLGGGQR